MPGPDGKCTCMRVLMVSAGWEAVAASRPAVTPAAIVADPSGSCWNDGDAANASRSAGITPRYPPTYRDSLTAVTVCSRVHIGR